MKWVKMLGLTAIAAIFLMVFGGGNAAATELTCPHGVMCEVRTTIHAESENKVVLDAVFGTVECDSTSEGHTWNTGGAAETVEGPITQLTFTNCGTDKVEVTFNGSLAIHTEGGVANGNGTVTSTATRVDVTHAGFTCIFETNGTTIGRLTGSSVTTATATLDISANIPRVGGGGGAFCGAAATWTGSYKVTTPDSLDVD